MTGKHEGRLVESHDEKHKEEHKGKHDKETWRPFDFGRKSWRENMIESHKGKSCRLFDQAIYTYLISCRIESGFRIELSSQASQPDLSAQVQLLNPTRHFLSQVLNLTRSVYSQCQWKKIFSETYWKQIARWNLLYMSD